MSYDEQETLIRLNQADLKEGWFSFGTSRQCDFEKLIRRIGSENVLSVTESKDREGKTTFWNCKVSSKCLSRANWGIRRRTNTALNLSGHAKLRGFARRKDTPLSMDKGGGEKTK